MRLLFVATALGNYAYAIQDELGTLWLLTSSDRRLRPAPEPTEAGLREVFTHLCWNVQTAPPQA